MTGFANRTKTLFRSRLQTLDRLLDMAETQWREAGKDADGLAKARVTDDMLPLGTQIAFACNQVNQFADFAAGRGASFLPREGHDTLADCRVLIADSLARLDGIADDDDLARGQKIVSLGKQGEIPFEGADYIDEWLIPNFYFHMVTAYAILRMNGIAIGKHDFMRHLAPRVRAGSGEPATAATDA